MCTFMLGRSFIFIFLSQIAKQVSDSRCRIGMNSITEMFSTLMRHRKFNHCENLLQARCRTAGG